MTGYAAARLAMLSAAFALATAALGWWAVAIVALAWVLLDHDQSVSTVSVGIAAGLGWGILLGWDARGGHVGALSVKLAEVLHLPSAALCGATLVFPAILAGSAAALTRELGRAFWPSLTVPADHS